MQKILMSLLMILMLSGCTEWALLLSSGGLVINQNAYSKVYSGMDIVTIIKTDKSIKSHAEEILDESH